MLLHTLSIWALVLSGISFVVIALDLMFHRQKMMIMTFVWPVTAHFGPFALWSYFGFGRQKPRNLAVLFLWLPLHFPLPYWRRYLL